MSYQDEKKDHEHQELLTEAERDSLWETDVKDEWSHTGGAGEHNGPVKAPFNPEEPLYTALWKIWIAPKQTIRRIVEVNPSYLVFFIAILLGGIGQGVGNATFLYEMSNSFDLGFDIQAVLVFSFIIGFIVAAFIFFVGSALLKWVGSWLGGKASHRETRAAYAWSNVSILVTLPLSLLMIAIMGVNYFTIDPMDMSFMMNDPVTAVIYTLANLVSLVAFVWGIIILVGALSEVHQFSIGRTIGTLAIIFAIICGITLVLAIAAIVVVAVVIGGMAY